ncbi:MAG: zinc-ribbon domain-containing protein [Deltaproteobacteria bacterium]|nr:zinc-ribbon domain-containing protein [Deltaproteobacteria bacterium]
MKFTCDSCGAQYQIADEKLGAKGVKVRCRKCSYLIIVRPKSYEPVAKTTIDPVITGELEAATTGDADQTAARDTAPELSSEISSDFGLSQEFRAMGFEEESGVKRPPRPATLSVGLDVAGLDESFGESSSPFASTSSGGSLDDLAEPEDHTRRLGLSDPPATDDLGESTKVEPNLAKAPSAWSLDSETDPFAAGKEEPTNSAPTPVARPTSGNGHASAPKARATSGSNFLSGEVEVGAMLQSVERNELAEIRSSVDAEMAGLSRELDGWAGGMKDHDEVDALAKLETRAPSPASPIQNGESVLGTGIEGELGDAFDAMFSPAQVPSDDFAGLSAKTEMSARPPEPPIDLGGSDKLPTRVFDTEAMANLAAEQERAVHVVGVQKAKPAPEWYVAIDDAQVGPLTLDDVTQRWRSGDVGPNSLCWKQGMADWTAIRFTEGLKQLVEKETQEARVAPKVERRQAEEEEAMVARPPQISMASEMEPPRATAAAQPAKIADAPAWRPSAASLLATLAAEELADPGPVVLKEKKSDVALGPAIPATSNALEKLLESSSATPVQSPFGAAEKSESAIRPLPRRPDTVSSVPLRDPTLDRPKSSNTGMIAAAILGGCLVIAVALVAGPKLLGGGDPPAAVAPPSVPSQPAAMVAPTNPPNGVSGQPLAAGGVPGQPLAAGGVPGQPAANPGAPPPTEAAVAPPPTPVPSEPAKPVLAAAEVPEPKSADEGRSKKGRAAKKERTVETKSKVREEEPPPPAPPPPRAATPESEEDDLLGASTQKKRLPQAAESSDLPRQLDDSDILGVLRKNRDDVRGCLDKQASADPTLDGTMTIKAVIEKGGQAKRVTISPDKFKSSAVGKCVSAAVQRWKFPQFTGPAIPIDFPVHVRGR